MMFLDLANDTVRSGFDFLIDILKIAVDFLKKIPTGFGVSLFYFFVACIVTGVVVSGIVNVVKISSFVPHTETGKKGKELVKGIRSDAKRYDSDYESWFDE